MLTIKYEAFAVAVRKFNLEPQECSPTHWHILGGDHLVNVWPFGKGGFEFGAAGQPVRTGTIGDAITAAGPEIGEPPEPAAPAHTPGPWYKDDSGNIFGGGGRHICACRGWHNSREETLRENMANVALISTADDLLAECEALADVLGMAEWGTSEYAESILKGIMRLHYPKLAAAVAKAKGRI